ncbi:MAG: HEAT repeat domain-containing protein [Planctomycetes bacterium]|nr:HEAT repeat domain-containing protein [Planctomycetota bacterium]
MSDRDIRPRHIHCISAAAADRVIEILGSAGIPASRDPEPIVADGVPLHAVAVPPAHFLRARSVLLDESAEIVVCGRWGEEPILTAAERREASSLFRELVPGGVTGAKVRASVEEFYLGAAAPERRRAIEALALLGEEGRDAAFRLLGEACRGNEAEPLWELAGFLGRRPIPAWPEAFLELLRDPEPQVRARAATAMGKAGDPSALPHLVRLYLDPSPEVQAEAADSVWRIAGEDDGFHPDLEPREKTRIVEEWRKRLE